VVPYWLKPTNKPSTAPKLDAISVHKAFRLINCRRIVGTDDGFEAIEMPVAPDEVRPIFFHPKVPTDGCIKIANRKIKLCSIADSRKKYFDISGHNVVMRSRPSRSLQF
jgi:hypothetical protein